MIRHLRTTGTGSRSHLGIGRPVQQDQHTEDDAHDEISWDGDDPDIAPGARLDAEIADAAKALFFAPDLIRPGPGLLPFGTKARDRRERRRDVDTIAATRRTQLGELLTARRDSHVQRSASATRHGHPRTVAALLTALVIAVAVAGWLMSQTTNTAAPGQDVVDSGSAARDLPSYKLDPITPVIAAENAPRPAPVPDLTSPEAAAGSWLAAWCPIDPHWNPDALAAGIRGVMTDEGWAQGWAQFTAAPGQTMAVRGVTASCSTPVARLVSRPPGSDTTVVVLVSATRTITGPDNTVATRVFRIERRQFVVRGVDELWRVDVPAVGG